MKQLKIAVTTLILILVVGLAGYFLYKHIKQKNAKTYKLKIEITQNQFTGGYQPPSLISLNSDAESINNSDNQFELTLTIFNENNTLVYTHSHPEDNENSNCNYLLCNEITSPEITGELVVGETYFAKIELKNENISCESEKISFVFEAGTNHIFTYTLTKI